MVFLVLNVFAEQESCRQKIETFNKTEKVYDAIIEAEVASTTAVKFIRDFRKEGNTLLAECKAHLNAAHRTRLAEKLNDPKVKLENYKPRSLSILKKEADKRPDVITYGHGETLIHGKSGAEQP